MKDFPKVFTWRLELNLNLRRVGGKAPNLPLSHYDPNVEIIHLISPTLWPPNNPYINPLDLIWSVLQEEIYRYRVHDELCNRIVDYWNKMAQRIIDEAVKLA